MLLQHKVVELDHRAHLVSIQLADQMVVAANLIVLVGRVKKDVKNRLKEEIVLKIMKFLEVLEVLVEEVEMVEDGIILVYQPQVV